MVEGIRQQRLVQFCSGTFHRTCPRCEQLQNAQMKWNGIAREILLKFSEDKLYERGKWEISRIIFLFFIFWLRPFSLPSPTPFLLFLSFRRDLKSKKRKGKNKWQICRFRLKMRFGLALKALFEASKWFFFFSSLKFIVIFLFFVFFF